MPRLKPLKRYVLLVDDPPDEPAVPGRVVRAPSESGWRTHMDYAVAGVGGRSAHADFGVGDRVVLRHPNAGRGVTIDGAPYRVVRLDDIIAVC